MGTMVWSRLLRQTAVAPSEPRMQLKRSNVRSVHCNQDYTQNMQFYLTAESTPILQFHSVHSHHVLSLSSCIPQEGNLQHSQLYHWYYLFKVVLMKLFYCVWCHHLQGKVIAVLVLVRVHSEGEMCGVLASQLIDTTPA